MAPGSREQGRAHRPEKGHGAFFLKGVFLSLLPAERVAGSPRPREAAALVLGPVLCFHLVWSSPRPVPPPPAARRPAGCFPRPVCPPGALTVLSETGCLSPDGCRASARRPAVLLSLRPLVAGAAPQAGKGGLVSAGFCDLIVSVPTVILFCSVVVWGRKSCQTLFTNTELANDDFSDSFWVFFIFYFLLFKSPVFQTDEPPRNLVLALGFLCHAF